MKREIAEAWVKDLRTNPPQTTGELYDGKGYCCLGRLCLVLGASFNESDDEGVFGNRKYYPTLGAKEYKESEVLPLHIQELAGMNSNNGEFDDESYDMELTVELTLLNDEGRSFADIADIIEKNWEKL